MPQKAQSPQVTIAMAMHNSSRYLRECIDSVLAQTFGDFELLIADDGSTDDSVEIVASYVDPRIRLLRLPHDFTASLNALLRESRGEYIARMDSDDIMMPGRLSAQVDYLKAHPEVDAVCLQAEIIDADGCHKGCIGHGSEPCVITLAMMLRDNAVCNPSTMMRRSFVERHHLLYRSDSCYAEDYRFWTDFLIAGGAIVYLPDTLLRYRHSPGQVTATHRTEMDAVAAQVKSDILTHLISEANPGYTDPVVGASGNDLTLIIPFLNEGEEVENTIRSFLAHGGAGRVDIMAINDASYDSFHYMERLTAIPGVTYILNRERLGVAASRDKGVALCRTPYFLLLDAHMRAYDDTWLTEIPRMLRENDRQILCCQTRFLMRDELGAVTDDSGSTTTYGARMTFKSGALMPGIEWVKEERRPACATEEIQCVLGAGYAASRRYWMEIGGLEGLDQYGCDEQLMSLKTWMDGGRCLLLKDCVLGHIYRKRMPYTIDNSTMLRNSLFISESLFPLKERCKARAAACLTDRDRFVREFLSLGKQMRGQIGRNRQRPATRSFAEVVEMNRHASSLDRQLKSDITNRIAAIASRLMESSPDSNGLFDGAAAYGIWLSLYAGHTGDENARRHAEYMMHRASDGIDKTDITFSDGAAGIGWALRFLHQENLLEATPALLDHIDSLILEHIASVCFATTTDRTLPTGAAGVLAYCCIARFYERYPQSYAALDAAASSIIADNNGDFTGLFYAFLWMQLRSTPETVRYLPTDWGRPSPFIAKDPRFWNISLYDGILASSTSILNRHS